MSGKHKPLTEAQIMRRRETDAARYRREREALGKVVVAREHKAPLRPLAPAPKKPAMTPSRHVSTKGPGGTAQAPDMSRTVRTTWPTPPGRYDVTGPVVGGFATMGVGRYL